jgi:hypothetical protein
MESSSSIRSAHAAGSDDSTLDWPVGHPRISCRLLHFYVSSNLPIPIGLISQDRLLLRSLFLSEMFTEPMGGLQRKSAVYGLNGLRPTLRVGALLARICQSILTPGPLLAMNKGLPDFTKQATLPQASLADT